MKRLILASALLGLAGAYSSASAAIIVPTSLDLWTADTPAPNNNSGAAVQQALPSARGAIAGLAGSFVSGVGAYTTPLSLASPPSPDTINGFLQTAFCANARCTTVGDLSGATGAFSAVTLFEFQFTVTGTGTITVTHDDGVSLFAEGGGGNNPVGANLFPAGASAPTFSATNTATLGAGTYDLFYTAANGQPEVLTADFTVTPAPAPEPASLTLIGSALVGLGWLSRRRRKAA